MLPELLAPAGSFDAAVAAFTYGADAVYLGLSRFSARADAQNFSDDELKRIVAFARSFDRPKKLYVTLNTLLESHERSELLPSLALLEELRIDGVIVQDLGLAKFIHKHFPKIPLHASTQLACTSTAGARALKALGFVRVVTARELTLAEAAEIGRQAEIEIEVFVHGALCYSLSGLCLFSSLTTGRSGNRGRCAYCCRQAFRTPDGASAHPFSMRDLSLVQCGNELRTLGLASLKIEGRMKNPLYVSAVTALYRAVLDGTCTAKQLEQKSEDLRTIFSRPWTPLYALTQETSPKAIIDPHCVGHRGAVIGKVNRVLRDMDGLKWLCFDTTRAIERHDGIQLDPPEGGRPIGFAVDKLRDGKTKRSAITLPAGSRVEVALPRDLNATIERGATVYCSASQAVRRAFPVPTPRSTETRLLKRVDLTLTLSPTVLELSGEGITVSTPAELSPAKDPARSREAAEKLLARLGDEGFSLGTLTLHNPQELFLPASLLNATRRAWAERARQHLQAPSRDFETLLPSCEQTDAPASASNITPHYTVKVSVDQNPQIVDDRPDALVVAIHTRTTLATLEPWLNLRPRIALPVALRNQDLGAMAELIGALSDKGFRAFECADLTSWQLLQDLQPACDAFDITADWTWYATNPDGVDLQNACGLTGAVTGPEANLPNLLSLPRTPPREILIAQYAPLFISYTCPLTSSALLIDRNGERLRIARLGTLWSTFNERPWSACEHLQELLAHGFNRFRIDLSWAGKALPSTPWRALLKFPQPMPSHFAFHRDQA